MAINLLDFDQAGLASFFAGLSEAPTRSNMRARQALRWIHRELSDSIEAMTDVAKPLRQAMLREATIDAPVVIDDTSAADGTRKWLIDVGTGNAIETVYIPEDDRGTLCISSQAGCALDCAFCSTGKQGFNRNLSVAEIIGQLWHANRALLADGVQTPWVRHGRHPITNVVMMGMGEPLANFDHVVTALNIMLDDCAYGLSRRRVTVSTSGIVPAILRLADACPVALAVSLHAGNDALRDRLVPINKKYPLATLVAACVRYIEKAPRDFVTFEYVMLDQVNDSLSHARELIAIARQVPCKFNLIPFNAFPRTEFKRSPRIAITAFQRALTEAGLVATIRKTRGDDIDAACGQLAGHVQDKTQRALAWARKTPTPVTAVN